MTVALLACGWGAVVAMPVVALLRRVEVGSRTRALVPSRRAVRGAHLHHFAGWLRGTTVGRVVAAPLRARGARRARDAVTRDLPVAVDLVCVAVGAGCAPLEAIRLAVQFAPAPVAEPFARVVRATTAGVALDDALRDVGQREPAVRPLAETLRTSARLGSPAAPSLTRLAAEVRADVRRRAEARARTVPVRLLFPLVFCVLPAFGLLTVAPVVLAGLRF